VGEAAAAPERSADWWEGWHAAFEAAGRPTLRTVRRLRGHLLPQDPQAPTVRAVAAEVEAIRRAIARGARVDEVRGRLLRAVRVIEGDA
jgi:hypothetical protein